MLIWVPPGRFWGTQLKGKKHKTADYTHATAEYLSSLARHKIFHYVKSSIRKYIVNQMLKQTDITTVEKDVWMQKIQSNLLTDIIMVLGMCVKVFWVSKYISNGPWHYTDHSNQWNSLVERVFFFKDILNSNHVGWVNIHTELEECPTLITWGQ